MRRHSDRRAGTGLGASGGAPCIGLLLLVVLVGPPLAPPRLAGASQSTPPAPHQDAARFREADEAFRRREDPERAWFALRRYRELDRANPGDAEAAWRLSMAYYFAGMRLAETREEEKRLYGAGRDAGVRAAELQPDCAPCHLFAAVNMALYGQAVGILRMLFTLGKVKSHLRESIALDPYFFDAAALRVLGYIEQELPPILGGSDKRAQRYLEEAIERDPDEPLNYLFYARFLYDERKRPADALRVAERGLQVPEPGYDHLESRDALRSLRNLVAELRAR